MSMDRPEEASDSPVIDRLIARARELQQQGSEYYQAFGLADLETRISCWPPAWGDDLWILLYGDFTPPPDDVAFPDLGIRVGAKKREDSVIKGALTVLDAHVTVQDKSLDSVLDAVRRINVLIGAWTLVDWAHGHRGWWCYITHGTPGGGLGKLDGAAVEAAAKRVLNLPLPLRRKLDAALYWIRATRSFALGVTPPAAVLEMYSHYWNAFECLVEAVAVAHPPQKLPRDQKQAQIDTFVNARDTLTARDIAELYHQVVNPGFVGKATHALRVCFQDEADRYIRECFSRPDQKERLYDVRNAINHGEVDAEDPRELVRIQARLSRLWIIVWIMFARFIQFSAPMDLPEDHVSPQP
jgi:hypothetical protein